MSILKPLYLFILYAGAIGILLFTLLSEVGPYGLFTELISHFRIHYLIIGLLLLPLVIWQKKLLLLIALLVPIAINLFAVLPWYLSFEKPNPDTEYIELKLITSNVKFNSTDYRAFIDFVEDENPDIVMMQELNPEWIEGLQGLIKKYPYKKIEDPGNNFGIGTLSKFRISSSDVFSVGGYLTPTIITELDLDGATLIAFNIHPMPPISGSLLKNRNEMFDEITNRENQLQGPRLVAGDFNITPWSKAYKKLINNTNLKNASEGRGLQKTWPLGNPNYKNFENIQKNKRRGTDWIPGFIVNNHSLKIPIDHVLISDDIHVKSIQTGPNIGSDHLPLVVELLVPRR